MAEFKTAKTFAGQASSARERGDVAQAALLEAFVPMIALAEAHVEAWKRFGAGMTEAANKIESASLASAFGVSTEGATE
jgi:hypothetical protein